MLLSIIIPAYNASSTIGRCLDSVLCQAFEDFEIIVVNDGSKDDTGEICHRYAEKDVRIRVIDKENAGVSSARNTGMNAARGKYIQFVDADDYIDPDMCQLLVEKMCTTDSDLVMCGFVREYFLNNRMCGCERRNYLGCDISCVKELGKHFGVLYEKMLISSPCNKLYRLDLIQANRLEMLLNLNLGEDLIFNLDYISLCQSVSIIEQCPYHYTCSERDSLTGGYGGLIADNAEYIYRKVRQFCIDTNCFKDCDWAVSKMYLRSGFKRLQNYAGTMERKILSTKIKDYFCSWEVRESVQCKLRWDLELSIYKLLIRSHMLWITYAFLYTRPLIKKILIHRKYRNNNGGAL